MDVVARRLRCAASLRTGLLATRLRAPAHSALVREIGANPVARAEPAIALVALLNPAGEILLLLRDDKPGINYPGHWSLIGGHRDGGDPVA